MSSFVRLEVLYFLISVFLYSGHSSIFPFLQPFIDYVKKSNWNDVTFPWLNPLCFLNMLCHLFQFIIFLQIPIDYYLYYLISFTIFLYVTDVRLAKCIGLIRTKFLLIDKLVVWGKGC